MAPSLCTAGRLEGSSPSSCSSNSNCLYGPRWNLEKIYSSIDFLMECGIGLCGNCIDGTF